MRRRSVRVVAIAILLSLLGTPAWAGFAEGVAAYKRGDYAAALREFRPLAEQGDAHAQYNLGLIYYEGHGVPKDYAKAVRWYRKAAAQGDAEAQHNLGTMYLKGEGVPQDHNEAAKWYRSAAEQGYAEAQLALGIMYYDGLGVPLHDVRAYMWISLAASRIPPGAARDRAIKFRDAFAKFMTPAQIAEAKRLAREWTAKHKR